MPKDIDKRLLRRQALMDSVNEFHWTHPGLVPRKCPLPPRTLGALRFFLRWFDSATSWPLERSNVLETLWSFKDAALDFSALHPIEAERWKVFPGHFPADGHEAMLAFYAGWMEALRAGKPPDPAAMMPPPGLAESIYEEELLCEARVRSTVPGVVPLWYGRPMVDEIRRSPPRPRSRARWSAPASAASCSCPPVCYCHARLNAVPATWRLLPPFLVCAATARIKQPRLQRGTAPPPRPPRGARSPTRRPAAR